MRSVWPSQAAHAANGLLGPDVVNDVAQFVGRDVCEIETSFIEGFIHLEDRLAHEPVRILGSASKKEILAAGNPLMAIGRIKREPKKARHALLGDASFFAHFDDSEFSGVGAMMAAAAYRPASCEDLKSLERPAEW